MKIAFIASLGMLISLGSTSLCSAQIGSGVSQPAYAAHYAQSGPAYSQAKPTNVDRTQAGRSQRSAGRGTLSSVLLGTRNQASLPSHSHSHAARQTPAYNQPQPQQPQSLPTAAPTPAQVYSQAFAYATQAGYSPADAQAYGRQMVQQYQARQVAAQQAQLAMANGQQPAAVHGSMMHQHMEQQRVQMAHGQAAATQNAKLMQAVQNQRAQMYRQAMAQRQAQLQAQWEIQQAAQDQQAEMAAVRAASLKVAQQFATQSNAVLGGNAQPISPADSITAQVLPSQYSQSVMSEEPVEALPLENAVEQMGQPVPEDVQWEMPSEIQQLPEEDANPLRRTPRRLPAVDPQPMPKEQLQQENELQLEGFSGESESVTPVSYQQPAGQSYGSQGYAPQMAIGEELNSQTPEFYEQQLQVSPPQMTYGQNEKTFSVELESEGELTLSDPLFQDTNTSWDSQSAPSVKPPTGIRAQSVSTHIGPGRKRSRSGFPMSRVQEPNELDLNSGEMSQEDLPAPRDYDDDDLSRDSIVKSCDEMRRELLDNSIRSINLDLSTPLNSVVLADASDEQKVRDWKDPNGNTLARGKAVSATRYGVNIIDENGLARTLSLSTLSGTDQKHAWDLMDLPFECDLVASNILNHNFTPSTVTWYASALCHKPLYFEDIQLERYGHTKGPIRQPVRSAARFLGQAALLPHQIGLHPPNECQYALGLYRPGNCAPYLRTPFPWERRAVGYEAAALAGVFLLIP